MKNSSKNENLGVFNVGDIIKIGDSSASGAYIITMCMPQKDPSYYMSIAANGSIATIWKGSIVEKIGHFDLDKMFEQMQHDLLYGSGGSKKC